MVVKEENRGKKKMGDRQNMGVEGRKIRTERLEVNYIKVCVGRRVITGRERKWVEGVRGRKTNQRERRGEREDGVIM